ncbi:MAG: hypothetical protein ACRD3E_03515 [Terriglobales bacterium]
MQVPRQRPRRETSLQSSVFGRQRLAAAVMIAVAVLAGCSIQEQKSADNKDKKVEIKTPFGQLKVNTGDVDVKDTGLPAYPGARRVPNEEHDSSAANVNISSGSFGLKVVAIKFDSDDSPDKVLGFYRDKVKAYGGKFLECEGTNLDVQAGGNEEKELTCDHHSGRGDAVELKAGTPNRQHIVSVKPHGNGSEFALVYVSKSGGKEGEL